jgi:BASS family bile acid:Na+ symporter
LDTPIDSIQIHFNKESLVVLNICLGYIMFGVALELKKDDFIHLIKFPKAAFAGVLSQYIVFPLLTFLLIIIARPHPSIALGMILIAACPSGNISNFITHTAKGNTALSISLTALSTVLSPLLTPLSFTIFGKMAPGTSQLLQTIHVTFMDVFQSLVVLLLCPLLLGTLVSYFFPAFTERSKKFFKITSLLIFFSFIIGAIAKNTDIFVHYIYLVIGLVFIQDLLGFVSGYFLASSFDLNERDRRSISIETGIHNSGLGLILIFSFFNGLGGMALIAAWWGIWHLIAGMSIAWYWNRKSVMPEPKL